MLSPCQAYLSLTCIEDTFLPRSWCHPMGPHRGNSPPLHPWLLENDPCMLSLRDHVRKMLRGPDFPTLLRDFRFNNFMAYYESLPQDWNKFDGLPQLYKSGKEWKEEEERLEAERKEKEAYNSRVKWRSRLLVGGALLVAGIVATPVVATALAAQIGASAGLSGAAAASF